MHLICLLLLQDALGPQVTIRKAQTWMRISFMVLGFILVKIVYLSTGQFNVMPFIWVICGIEIFIQIIGLYFVRESIDDLKQEILILRKAPAPSKKSSLVPENKSQSILKEVELSTEPEEV